MTHANSSPPERFTRLDLDGLVLVELKVNGDERGFFIERFQESRFREGGITTSFVQDNHSRSGPGVLRGLHYQHSPMQSKLVGVLRGRIWDVAVDIRPHSSTFGKSHALELGDTNGCLLLIPPGFAHGFCVLGDEPADVLYKVDAPYNPQGEGALLWNDPELAIEWPLANPTVSPRDAGAETFASYRTHPPAWPAT